MASAAEIEAKAREIFLSRYEAIGGDWSAVETKDVWRDLARAAIATEECGRWWNGELLKTCSKAGSEECDWDCPHRATLYK